MDQLFIELFDARAVYPRIDFQHVPKWLECPWAAGAGDLENDQSNN